MIRRSAASTLNGKNVQLLDQLLHCEKSNFYIFYGKLFKSYYCDDCTGIVLQKLEKFSQFGG